MAEIIALLLAIPVSLVVYGAVVQVLHARRAEDHQGEPPPGFGRFMVAAVVALLPALLMIYVVVEESHSGGEPMGYMFVLVFGFWIVAGAALVSWILTSG